MAQLELRDVGKAWPAAPPVLHGVSLPVQQGGFLAVVGPEGSGKTTLLRLISGQEAPSQGGIWLEGEEITHLPADQRPMAMVYHRGTLYPHMTVEKNIAYGLKARYLTEDETALRVREAARATGADKLMKKRPKDLTPAQGLDVGLARAMVYRPAVYLLDEPLAAAEAKHRPAMEAALAGFHRRQGATFIYATREPQQALALAGQVAVLHQGRVQQLAPPPQLMEKPQNLFVARYMSGGRMNLVDGVLVAADGELGVQVGERVLPLLAARGKASAARHLGRAVVWGIMPQDNSQSPQLMCQYPQLVLQGVVQRAELWGADVVLLLQVAGSTMAVKTQPGDTVRAGESVPFAVNTVKALLFDKESGENLLMDD